MTLPVYFTGTVSVSNLGTVVTGLGSMWSGINAREGDFFTRTDGVAVITEVTDATHLKITPWPGATVAGGAYGIQQNYVGRVVGVAAAEDVGVMLEKLHTDGLPFIVGDDETVPDPSYGDEGQLAFKPSTGQWWVKTGGVWVPSYGLTALGYGGTSATSLTIGTGTKVFTTQSSLAYNGSRVRATSAANHNNWMEGITSYVGTTLTMTADTTGGSGTYADWLFSIAGQPGASGSGSGNVTGPGSAIDSHIAVFNGITGTVIKDGGKAVGELLPLIGGTMTGPLVLAADPTVPMGAATKQYVDLAPAMSFVPIPAGRLSLSSTSAKPGADIVGASTLWYVDCGGGTVPIWDNATASFKARPFTGALQLALDPNAAHAGYHAANSLFDVYAWWDTALGQVRLGTSFYAGVDFVERGNNITALVQKKGIWVNVHNAYLRINNTGTVAGVDYIQPGVNQTTYLGSISTVAAGLSDDSRLKRLVYNAYNPVERFGWVKCGLPAYPYSAATPRQVAGDPAFKVQVVIGLPGTKVRAQATHFAVSSVTGSLFHTYVGFNATTPYPETEATFGSFGKALDAVAAWGATHGVVVEPPIGLRDFTWLEVGSGGAVVNTWYPASINFHNGLIVEVSL
jgi:hypothetical protein